MSKIIVILDPGHGGLNDAGVYVTAGKRSRHAVDGSVFYEGHEMRKYAKEWATILTNLGYEVAFTVDPSDYTDVPLSERTRRINEEISNRRAVLVSIHSNADSDSSPHPGRASGKEVYTSVGVTPSDHLAKFYVEEFKKSSMGDFRVRKDMSDGFPDKEANFWMLTRTKCPAILVELGFHTNDQDVRMMRRWDYRLQTGLALARAIKRFDEWWK